MRDLRESCRIAVVQAAPVMFDKAACTVKAVELIRAAAAERAELIVFPELFIPGYAPWAPLPQASCSSGS